MKNRQSKQIFWVVVIWLLLVNSLSSQTMDMSKEEYKKRVAEEEVWVKHYTENEGCNCAPENKDLTMYKLRELIPIILSNGGKPAAANMQINYEFDHKQIEWQTPGYMFPEYRQSYVESLDPDFKLEYADTTSSTMVRQYVYVAPRQRLRLNLWFIAHYHLDPKEKPYIGGRLEWYINDQDFKEHKEHDYSSNSYDN